MRKLYFLLFIPLAFTQCQEAAVPPQPNILFILTDDQGWGDLAFHGNDTLSTPHLNWLAEHSTELTRFYVSPVCAPTRASILTGRYHLATGTSWVTHRTEVMREEEVTIAELLKANGYRTGLFGKWHNGSQYPHDPLGQGFDKFFGFREGHLNNYFDVTLTRNFDPVATKGYVADVLADSAMKFMEKEGPFFCMLTLNTPHSPFQVPDRYFDKYAGMGLDHKTASVYGMVESIDDIVGRMLDKLNELQKQEETVVIFMTDNGPNGVRYNGGYKGVKAHVDEGGVRVPLLIRYPRLGWDKGRITDVMAAHIDLLPTLAGVTGTSLPDSLQLHGTSLVPLLMDTALLPERTFFTHQVVREFDTIPGAVRTSQYLLTLKPGTTGLYDLAADPFQKIDLADSLPQLVASLKNDYSRWFEEVTREGVVPPAIQIGHSRVPEVELPAPDVSRRAGADFEGGFGWSNDWLKGVSDSLEVAWQLKAVDTATYGIWVEMACETQQPFRLKVTFRDQQLRWEIPNSLDAPLLDSPDRVKRGEVYERKWPLVFVGNAKVTDGEGELVLTTEGFSGTRMEVKSVRLRLLK